jgi:hypothetical protein
MANAAKWMTEISGVSRAFGAVAEGVDVYAPYGDRSTTYILPLRVERVFRFQHA